MASIKRFEYIREVMRYIFMYGDSSAKDIANSGTSGKLSTINSYISYIEKALDNGILTKTTLPKRKQDKVGYKITFNDLLSPADLLTGLMDYPCVTQSSLIFYFTFMQMFTDSENEAEYTFENIEKIRDAYSDIELLFAILHQASLFSINTLVRPLNDKYADIRSGDPGSLYKISEKDDQALDAKIMELYESQEHSSLVFQRALNMFATEVANGTRSEKELDKLLNTTDLDDHPQLAPQYFSEKLLKYQFTQFAPNTVRSHLKELMSIGVIESRGKLRNTADACELTGDLFKSLNKAQLSQLIRLVNFRLITSPVSMPGYILKNTLMKYMVYKGWSTFDTIEEECSSTKMPFSFSHTSIQNVLDNEIVWTLLDSMRNCEKIVIKYNGENDIVDHTVFPMMITCEHIYGKQYLCAYDYNGNTFDRRSRRSNYFFFRIDRITEITGEEIPKKKKEIFYPYAAFLAKTYGDEVKENKDKLRAAIKQEYKKLTEDTWNNSLPPQSTKPTPKKVLLHFDLPKDYNYYYEQYVLSTGKNGSLVRDHGNIDNYSVEVRDPIEMIPWVRSLGQYATVDKESCPELYQRTKELIKEALDNYGIVS